MSTHERAIYHLFVVGRCGVFMIVVASRRMSGELS